MKKNPLKKAAVKLDLDKIEIDSLSDSMLNGLQGGYVTQPTPLTVCGTPTNVNCTFGCATQMCSIGCTHTSICVC